MAKRKMKLTVIEKHKVAIWHDHNHDEDYTGLRLAVKSAFENAIAADKVFFMTDADDLYGTYLKAIPEAGRKVHTCHACRRFIQQYGALVRVKEDGTLQSVFWNSKLVPDFYNEIIERLQKKVEKSKIIRPFVTSEKTLGTPKTGNWHHFAVEMPTEMVYKGKVLSAFQRAAEIKENYLQVESALKEFKTPMLDAALSLFTSESLNRPEKFIGPVKFLRDLKDRPKGNKGINRLWKEVAIAPNGFCHPRASVVGSLLSDLAEGKDFLTVKRNFAYQTKSDNYQRAKEAPSEGNIKAGEDIIKKLGAERSLYRRFAHMGDILKFTWQPAQEKRAKPSSVFGDLKTRKALDTTLSAPKSIMTWYKFSKDVLPQAQKLEFKAPSRGNYVALTTALYKDAPPILKWDMEDNRNPVALYVYTNGSYANEWSLTANAWVQVKAVIPYPTLWGDVQYDYLGKGAILLLEGCVDQKTPNMCLFSETLIGELYPARSTIEAFSNSNYLAGKDNADACGYNLNTSGFMNLDVRVTIGEAVSTYRIDRWD
jgi:hypothetical protein